MRLPLLAVGISLISATTASARIEPSFDLLHCTWHATDIVLVSGEDAGDQDLTVLEAWKGDLKVGQGITVPQARGSKMILFLKSGDGDQANWLPASLFGGMKVSAIWIGDDDALSAFQQNYRGPPVKSPLKFTLEKLKQKVDTILKTQGDLATAKAIADAAQRAAALRGFTSSENFDAREEAFEALGQCGPAAMPLLREMLADQSLAARHADVVKAFARAGGQQSVDELVALVTAELTFWRRTAPELQVGWWNGKGLDWTEVGKLRNRYVKVLEAFYAMQRLPDPRCHDVLVEFRDFWRSLPQLEDKSGLTQMSEACDEALRKIARKAQ